MSKKQWGHGFHSGRNAAFLELSDDVRKDTIREECEAIREWTILLCAMVAEGPSFIEDGELTSEARFGLIKAASKLTEMAERIKWEEFERTKDPMVLGY